VASSEPREASGLVLEQHGAAPHRVRLLVDAPGPGEVRVKMTAAGICQTDVAAVGDARTVPLLLGHEGAGIVEAVGAGVIAPSVGTRVVLAWRAPCEVCPRCRAGRLEHCDAAAPTTSARVRRAADGAPLDRLLDVGCFADYVVVPARAVVPLPRRIPGEVAALVGCAVATGIGAALWTAAVVAGESVAVWGTGGVGLNVVSGARLAGARTIVAIDPERRADARARGATHVAAPEHAADTVWEATEGRGLDHAFEVVGEPALMQEALGLLARGGQLTLVGAAARDATLAFAPRAFMSAQHRIAGCIYGSVHPHEHLTRLLDWVADGVMLRPRRRRSRPCARRSAAR
jgi:S-(hydroxymethyl)glutathione dehydrogenase / alcohol dehydrogenase